MFEEALKEQRNRTKPKTVAAVEISEDGALEAIRVLTDKAERVLCD